MIRPTTINLGRETDFTQLLKAKTRRTRYLKTVNVQLTKLFVDARNNLFLLLFAKAEIDLPQVDSLIFLVMARYIGTIKIEKGKNPRNKLNKPNAEGASESRRKKSCEGQLRKSKAETKGPNT